MAHPALAFTAAGAVGQVAQKNTLAAVQNDPSLYTDTAAKIAATAGEGAAANFLFSVGVKGAMEFVFPALRAVWRKPVLATELETTGKLWWKKAADPAEVDKAIALSGGTSVFHRKTFSDASLCKRLGLARATRLKPLQRCIDAGSQTSGPARACF